ncbi:MAG: hypothetical protein AAB554_03375 [Patescibacteria group bacterium]
MTRSGASSEEHESILKRLKDADAGRERIGEAAWDFLAHLLDIEQFSLAVLHAYSYESFWDEERKLDILERMHAAIVDAQAIMLCHRWKLSEKCHETRPTLYWELFPKLPPRTEKKERP